MLRRSILHLAAGGLLPRLCRASHHETMSVTRNRVVLTTPPDKPAHGSLRYALGFPIQVDPVTAGFLVMRMTEETPNYGFLDGSDIILLDDLAARPKVVPATRNEIQDGKLFLKSPLIGGFVPAGALRADGSSHPHAGTGFGVGQAHWFTWKDNRFTWRDPGRQDMNEVYQLAYRRGVFTTRRSEVRAQNGDDPLRIGSTGWTILVTGIKSAIPDGDDLLLAALAAREDRTAIGIGVIRWVRQAGTWRPSDFSPVDVVNGPVPRGPNPMEQCPWMEPSLDRDSDGRLLFSARSADVPKGPGYNLRVWRSTAEGWSQLMDIPNARLNSPITVNVAANGAAYLVSNPYDTAFIPETAQVGRGRERLVLWPLTGDRRNIGPPQLIRDCLTEFGQPPEAERGDKWMADHPNGLTVRLKDRKWHHLLCYRVCHSPRHASLGTPPSPRSGSYVEEVTAPGPALPMWRFAH